MTAHREAAYKNLGNMAELPLTEELSDRSIIIPLFVRMSDEEQSYIISTLKEILV